MRVKEILEIDHFEKNKKNIILQSITNKKKSKDEKNYENEILNA
jgi:hypothetical protein